MLNIPLIDIVMSLSSAIDLISVQMSNHQKRVAYISYCISAEMGLNEDEKKQIIIAGLLHDCGALHDQDKLRSFEYDFGTVLERHSHGYRGCQLIHNIEDFREAAEIIKFHHIYWNERNAQHMEAYSVPLGSHIIHLADRIDILINRNDEILKQRGSIIETIRDNSGRMFMPEAVEAFINVSCRESFWFELLVPYLENIIRKLVKRNDKVININKLISLASIFYQIIDFRSQFTSSHSIGVAECAKQLSAKMDFSKNDIKLIYVAGLMHDIGKLGVPIRILEKEGPLTDDEMNIIKKHTFDSFHILERIPQLEKVNRWISYHHERIDGRGYPFKIGKDDLDLGSRIMAVCDVFTALTEDRPYRKAMSTEKSVSIMENMATEGHLDHDVFSILREHAEEINHFKTEIQKISQEKYIDFSNINSFMASNINY